MNANSALSRRTVLGWGAAVAAGTLLAACSSGDEQADTANETDNANDPDTEYSTIRSTAVSFIWAPFLVAEAKGYFSEEGLSQRGDVAGQGVVANVVVSGDADFVVGSPMDTMKSTAVGQPLISFCAMVNTLATNIVITSEAWEAAGLDDTSTAEERALAMKGLRLASTGVASTPDLLIRYTSSNLGGLDPDKDVKITPIQGGGSAMLAAVQNGQIDGMAISSPISDQAISDLGMKYLFEMSTDPVETLIDFPYIVASCREDFLNEHPEQIAAYCRAIQRSLNFIQAEKQEFRQILLDLFTEIEPEVFDTAFEANYAIYPTTIVPSAPQFEQAKEFVVEAFAINGSDSEAETARAIEFEDTWNADYAQEAYDTVGSDY